MATQTAERVFMDTFVRADAVTRNAGGWAALHVLGGASQRITYLQAAPPCPARATVGSAKLRLFQADASTGNRTVSLRRVTEGRWSESAITWRNRPARTATVSASAAVNGAGSRGRMVELDVTADVQAWVNGAANYGWTLESSTANLIVFHSKNSSSRGPQLVVEWTMAPARPTDTEPNGGLFAASPKPMLRWSYIDRGSLIQPMVAARGHLKTTNTGWSVDGGYADPTFDTGVVATTIPQLALSETAWTGLGSGQRIWYSLQHQDSSGQWSQWSDPQQFGYAAPPSVVMTGPAATVSDTSFPVVWATDDQSRYQVLIDDVDTGRQLWDSREQSSTTARSVLVPRGVITRHGQRARVTVRVWDSVGRVAVPGVTSYAAASTEVVYTDDPAVDPVAGLTVTSAAEHPAARISWGRAAAAAQFGVWVDGIEVAVVDAADAAVAGSPGLYAHHLALSGDVDHEVTVKAIERVTVDGVDHTRASAANPVHNARYELFAVWLTMPGEPDRDVRFLAEDDADLVETTMPEVTARFDPAGSSTAVHVTTALRWFEGTLTDGILADYGDLDAETLRARMLAAKGDRLRPYTLIWGTHAVPVWITNVNVVGDFIPGAARYVVSFEFTAAVASPEYELQ